MDPRKLSLQELLRLCLESQDKAIWFEFVRRFQPLIAGVVLKRIRRRVRPTPGLVDDLVQDTYLKLCRNNFRALREFDSQHENAFFGFLKVVADRVVCDYFRSKCNDKHGGGADVEDLDSIAAASAASTHPGKALEREIIMDEVACFLQSQPPHPNHTRDLTVFWLYYRHGLTAKAISQMPGIGLEVKGVESTLFRLVRLIKEHMAAAPRKRASGE